jgi:hypothetical protein
MPTGTPSIIAKLKRFNTMQPPILGAMSQGGMQILAQLSVTPGERQPAKEAALSVHRQFFIDTGRALDPPFLYV